MYIHGLPIYIHGLPIYIHGLPIYIQGLPIYIGLYMLILVYIGLYWLIIGHIIDQFLIGFTKNGFATNQVHMAPNPTILAANRPSFRS